MSFRAAVALACLLASTACVGARPNGRFDLVDASTGAPDRNAVDVRAADARPLLPEMVGWWKLDGDVRDSSRHGNHGALEGIPLAAAWTAGRHAGALSFPPGLQTAGVLIPMSPSLKALRRITVAAWIRRLGTDVAVARQSGIVSQQDAVEPRAETFSLVTYLENLEAFIATSNAARSTGSGPLGAFSTGTAARQVWLHVAMTYDGATLRLYRNGEAVDAAPITRPLALADLPIYLGTNKNDHENQPFEGLLDDVLICADALSAAAISALAADADPASVCGS